MLGSKDAEHEISKLETFVERPRHGHRSRVDEKAETEHAMGDEWIPFLGAEAALAAVLVRKTK
jgi:hypothetical protein